MKFEKRVLDDMERCYCTAEMNISGEQYLLFASEANPGVCYGYHGKDFSERDVIWDKIGGTMTIIPFEYREGEFLAVTEMYLKVSPSQAAVVWGKKTSEGWTVRPVLKLPYLHRMDILHVAGKDIFIGATIAKDKQFKDDWQLPGQILMGEIPQKPEEGIDMRLIEDGLFINHGYYRTKDKSGYHCYFGSHNGLLEITVLYDGSKIKKEWLLNIPVGEIAVCDIDKDGMEEIMTIEPFHGNKARIYKNHNGKLELVYTYPNEIDFAHALTAGVISGRRSFLLGVRKGNEELVVIRWSKNGFREYIIDFKAGTANCQIVHTDSKDIILAANHTSKQACLYYRK
ncbi:MAG: hypothetical protein IJL94_03895 [Erysipelotrichaceae bacterium]|nr:hypothetical protein [Erysipelotrichaceae bacterium]